MSRGLGKLQREILQTLDEAKQHFREGDYRGGFARWDPTPCLTEEIEAISETITKMRQDSGPHDLTYVIQCREEERDRLIEKRDRLAIRSGWVHYKGKNFRIDIGIYDLRASCQYLAKRHNAYHYGVDQPFQAAFSRAVRGLVKREILVPVAGLLPIAEYDQEGEPWHRPDVHDLSDGLFVDISPRGWGRGQLRFVTYHKRYVC